MLASGVVALMMLTVPIAVTAQENIGTSQDPLTTASDITDWTDMGNQVPVCWETGGWGREKKIVEHAIANTWQWHANVDFNGWGDCPTSGAEDQVRIRVGPQDDSNSGAGGSSRVGTAALSSADDNDPGMNLSFNPDGTADRGRIEYVAVHEFGHVLGFEHEQDAPGNTGPAKCTEGVDPSRPTVPITAYDRDSIMNYCNRDGNGTGYLTDTDIAGVQQVYGVRRPNVATINPCASAPHDGLASLAAPWNDNGQTSVAEFPSDGTRFIGWNQWSIRDGGWGDEVKWVSGDFNGDGKTDIGAAWNNGGHNTLTVRLSTGSGFTAQHWLADAGGWIDTTRWMAGDFNGDGLSDIAAAWNNGGLASIAVFLSDGASFPGWTQWADRDGGWGDTVQWVAGDFDGDGKTDIGAAWNNDSRTTLTVRRSTGSSFEHSHWLPDAGHWWDAAIYVVGDYNADGRDDIAKIWNDMGEASIDLARSTGAAFQELVSRSRRDGGWGGIVRWVPGDFDGNGRSDIAAVWNNGGTNTLTVRALVGKKFGQAHWLTEAGGWIDSTAWCSGTFE